MDKTELSVGELKAHFSEVLEKVQQGHQITILFGKQKTPVAEIIPLTQKKSPIRLGSLSKKASFKINPGFKMTEDEFLNS